MRFTASFILFCSISLQCAAESITIDADQLRFGVADSVSDGKAKQSQSTGVNQSGKFIIVEASPNGYYHEIKNFTISGGCGQPNKQNDSTVAIYNGYNDCLGDTYSYSLIYKERNLATSGSDKVCSGSFTISGGRRNATLQINNSCNGTFREF